MNVARRGLNFLRGIRLLLKYRRTLPLPELLRGKRVAVIGAANSAFHTGKGSYIDSFDIVIRINKGTLLLKDNTWKNDLGRKTDILFHSFFENEKSGGGPLDFSWFDELGVRYVVNPIAAYEGYRVMLNFYKKYLTPRPTYSLSRELYARIARPLGTFRPTIGYCALMAVMECEFSELYITGFTFFRTPFGEGYRQALTETEAVRKFIAEQGLHNPDLELAAFAEKGHRMNWNHVLMDDALASILKASGNVLNEKKQGGG